MLNIAEKKRKLDHQPFQENWTKKYADVKQKDCTVCAFCYTSVVLYISCVQRHFQTNLSLKPQKRKVKPSKNLFVDSKKLVFWTKQLESRIKLVSVVKNSSVCGSKR